MRKNLRMLPAQSWMGTDGYRPSSQLPTFPAPTRQLITGRLSDSFSRTAVRHPCPRGLVSPQTTPLPLSGVPSLLLSPTLLLSPARLFLSYCLSSELLSVSLALYLCPFPPSSQVWPLGLPPPFSHSVPWAHSRG